MNEDSIILVTGASCGLGKEIAEFLIKNHKFKKLILTSRFPDAFNQYSSDKRIVKVAFNLFDSNFDFYNTDLYKKVSEQSSIDYIFYCASPYYIEKIREASRKSLLETTSAVANNILALRELSLKLSEKGCLIVSGAVGSERINRIIPSLSSLGGIGNVGSCSLHALHKGHLRDLVSCLHQEFKEKKIIHANISAFQDEVLESKIDDILKTHYVALKLIQIAFLSEIIKDFNIDILSKSVEKKIETLRSLAINKDIINKSLVFSNLFHTSKKSDEITEEKLKFKCKL